VAEDEAGEVEVGVDASEVWVSRDVSLLAATGRGRL